MSRLVKKPIILPEDINFKIEDGILTIKGPKGELKLKINPSVEFKLEGKNLGVSASGKNGKALQGTFYRLTVNMIKGVREGFEKKLEVVGVGYKVQEVASSNKTSDDSGKALVLNVGFSHSVEFGIPKGIDAKVEKNVITLAGIDKQLVGETAAQIRRIRKPEPYKGTGIKYVDEVIKRKAGKSAKAVGSK